ACFASALVAPLALAGGVRVQQAAALFRADLETYRAAPEDLRASPLVCVAAAGYEDRKLFDRPRWVPPLSPTGLARAVARNLRGIPEGGSTIPQQIAKLYLRSARRGTVGDKIREALFATWLVRQATPMELAGLYLNLGAGASIGGDRRPADGLDRLSLALFGLPLRRLSREDQLVLAGAPRGVRWLQAHPAISANRMAAARAWLVKRGDWDPGVRSYLDDGIDPSSAFRFVEGWTERGSGTASTVRSRASSRAPRCGRPSRPSAPTARCWRGRARSRRSCRSTTDRSPSSRRSIWRSNPSDPSRSAT
ncbi:MAG: hypothetical protein E6J85_08275, partial [Deltaproteobacteria bacterium]